MQLVGDNIKITLDYQLIENLEEWVDGTYRIDHDFRRLVIHTEKAQKALWHMFHKMVPLNSEIKLTKDEMNRVRSTFQEDKTYNLSGTYGARRVKSFTVSTFYGNEDAVATEEELAYDYEWPELLGAE